MIPTAVTTTVLSHPFQIVLMWMVLGRLIRMALGAWGEKPQDEAIGQERLRRREPSMMEKCS
jgi:hypothetical protein